MLDSCHHPLESESRSDFDNYNPLVCVCAGLYFMGSTNVAELEPQLTKEFRGPVNSLIVRRSNSI